MINLDKILRRIAVSSALGLAATVLIAGPAQAQPPVPQAVIEQITAKMTEGGIPADTQEALVDKLQSGEVLDSTSGTVTPTDSYTESLPGVERTVSIFPDGSRSWVDMQSVREPGDVVLFSTIGGCTYSGQWFNNCNVGISDAVSNASFVIDYQHVAPNPAQIRDYRAETCFYALGSCTVSGGIERASQSGTLPAWARMAFTLTTSGGVAGGQAEIGVRIVGLQVSPY